MVVDTALADPSHRRWPPKWNAVIARRATTMITRRDGQFVFVCDGDGSPHVLWTGVTDLRL
jgi:hypothetical protein